MLGSLATRAVFDCNLIISAIGWGGNPRSCLSLVSSGQVTLCVTAEIWEEFDARVREVLSKHKPAENPGPMLDLILNTAQFVTAAPLGKKRSRDLEDDKYLACALGAGAKFIVTGDGDLLDLEKPFGIKIVTPLQFLAEIRKQAGL